MKHAVAIKPTYAARISLGIANARDIGCSPVVISPLIWGVDRVSSVSDILTTVQFIGYGSFDDVARIADIFL